MELKSQQDKIEKLIINDSNLFISQSYFIDNGSQYFWIFQRISNTFSMPATLTEIIIAWKSIVLSNWKNKSPITASNILSPNLK